MTSPSILHADLRSENNDSLAQSDVFIDLKRVDAIGRGSQHPGYHSRILLGGVWWAISDGFEELQARWLYVRGCGPGSNTDPLPKAKW